MLPDVERLRALQRTGEIRGRTLPRAALLSRVKEHMIEETPRSVLRGQTIWLRAMGLVPPAYDVEAGLFSLLGAELAGYYEPKDKTMYLAGDLGEKGDKSTLFHELVHALQDQRWDLGPKLRHVDDAGDRIDALHALAEGDATSATMDFDLAGEGTSVLELPEAAIAAAMTAAMMSSEATQRIPAILRRSLIASYTDGLLFVNRLRRRGGWAEVDRAWARPPRTTEQLLHLEKYDADEPAVVVPKIPAGPMGPGFEELSSELPGEQSLRLTFEDWTLPKIARRAAAGWGGDRISVFTRGDEWVVAWHLVFDGPSDGACPEAEEAWAVVPPVQAGSPARREACEVRPSIGPLSATLRGCHIAIVAGPAGGSCEESLARSRAVLAR